MDKALQYRQAVCERILQWVVGVFALFFATLSPAYAGPELEALAAARVAVDAAEGEPAVIVLWTPGCLACRKSLNEIERFAAKAILDGISVKTVVPADARDAARKLMAERGLTLRVEADADKLDATSRRVLLDHPLVYAIDAEGKIVDSRAGLLGAWVLEDLAAKAGRRAEGAAGER